MDQLDQTPKESTDFSPFCFPSFSVSFPGLFTATGVADGERDHNVGELTHGPDGCGWGIHRVWPAGEHLETREPLPEP